MSRIYTINDAKEKMIKSCNYYKCRIEAWKKVTRVKTKSGADFKILYKNFVNCEFTVDYGIRRARVRFTDENGRREYDDINLYDAGHRLETPDEIENAIRERIENYNKWLTIDEKGANEIENQINEIAPQLEAIKKAIDKAHATNTHYTLQSYIKNFLYILND